MTTVSIEFPEGLLSALRRSPEEFAKEVRIAAAIHWYQRGEISMERAAEAADMDRREFTSELARRKVDVFRVDPDDLKRELRGA